MKHNVLLPIASLISILLVTRHLAADVVRGERRSLKGPAKPSNTSPSGAS